MKSQSIEQKHYTPNFYEGHKKGSYESAIIVLSIIDKLFKPKSMIDIGCGIGLWLKVAKENFNINDLNGVEGNYINNNSFEFDLQKLIRHDLKKELNLNRQYDIAISMEVAEHIPKENADEFIKTLTNHSKIILFSAALIGQEGTYHINEQLPEYWAEKFNKFGYEPIDFIRPKIWNEESVMYWYKQNTILYVHNSIIDLLPTELKSSYENTNSNYLFRIHPEHYFKVLNRKKILNYIHYKIYQVKKLINEGKFG